MKTEAKPPAHFPPREASIWTLGFRAGRESPVTEVELIEQAALKVGMKSLMNHGAASCVYTEGCEGVSQEHLIAFAREVALHCVAALMVSSPQLADDQTHE